MKTDASPQARPQRELTLFDSTSIIVGIIIGAGIYESSPRIASNVESSAWLLAMWLVGGVLALVGSLCYAELATSFPREGGDYAYLTRAMGRKMGFLFAWAELWVIRPGSIGAMAFIFARYARELVPQLGGSLTWYAVGAIAVLAAINLLGVREGKWTQNLLTTVKFLGLGAICLVGLFAGGSRPEIAPPVGEHAPDIRQALIFILYAYGGWNEMAYVAAEVRNPRKNIVRALILGSSAVTVIYLLATCTFLYTQGLEGVRVSTDVAGDVLQPVMGDWGRRAIQVLIAISALGAINGMLFTGSRIFYALGEDHRLFAWLGRWNAHRGTPARAMVAQTLVTLGLVIGFGRSENGFGSLVNFTAPVFWIFASCVAASAFLLRRVRPETADPYRTPLFPLAPTLFFLSSAFMIWSSTSWAIEKRSYEAFWAIGLLILGAALTFAERDPD